MEQQEQSNQQPQTSQVFKVRGMKTDLSESSFENSFAFENKNMRINIVDDDNTLFNLTNERGTKYSGISIEGIPIGVKKYDSNKAIVFTTTNTGDFGINKQLYSYDTNIEELLYEQDNAPLSNFYDRIVVVSENNGNVEMSRIYTGNIGFSANNPLEIEHYKDDNKDYFYIADGLNNLKCFVLKNDKLDAKNTNFDYIAKISGRESIRAQQTASNVANFFSGTIVYAFCYITKQGHKTGIIDVSDVYSITDYQKEYGSAPNKKCNIAFNVYVSGFSNTEFDKIEIYSLFRSELNGSILTRRVSTVPLTGNSISITDYNNGEIYSYQDLLSRFNSVLIPSTITQKNSTLFLGNIRTNNYRDLSWLIDSIKSKVTFDLANSELLNDNYYYYGLQLQDRYGNWSPVIYIGKSGNVQGITFDESVTDFARDNGYVAYRIMILDNKRIRNTICTGLSIPTVSIDNAKYGIDYYSPYFCKTSKHDIYNQSERIKENANVCDIYSPDIEFDENLIINESQNYNIFYKDASLNEGIHNVDINITGNTGVLYNNDNPNLGRAMFYDEDILWTDAITGYQKALQLLYSSKKPGDTHKIGNDWIVSGLANIGVLNIKEMPVNYKIYVWQPEGSLNDSTTTSILKTKKVSKTYSLYSPDLYNESSYTKTVSNIKLFDGTVSNIPVNNKVYGGIINQNTYPLSWSIPETFRLSNYKDGNINNYQYWDDDQKSFVDQYSLGVLDIYKYNGQPIEIIDSKLGYEFKGLLYNYSALCKSIREIEDTSQTIYFKGWNETSLDMLSFNTIKVGSEIDYSKIITIGLQGKEESNWPINVRVSNNYNRQGSVKIAYKTARHLVWYGHNVPGIRYVKVQSLYSNAPELTDSEIINGQWIPCSTKTALAQGCLVNIKEKYDWPIYECLKTEPYSLSDTNQATCILQIKYQESYINPYCRYDNLRGLSNYNGVTSDIFNKMNMVYNQNNNFFVYAGITSDTITDDSLSNTILYSDMKLANEKEDTFVNLYSTNFYTIDSNVKEINKLVVYNDKLLCFSNNSIVQILYDENVVVNTESVQSLSLASSDKVTGSQLISNTYGCLNKWSIGVFNDVLYFNDDINRKIIAYTDSFNPLNEAFGIETLNSKIFGKLAWDPINWSNTKVNFDHYAKDVHYISGSIDIAVNQVIGAFTSLYSYDKIPYIESIGKYTIAFKYGANITTLHLLREGDYNYFFDKYEPYWTTVIMNQNSLKTKSLSNIEFSTEAYTNNVPNNNFTFDTVTFWNDYQSNKMQVYYNAFGISLLKKKFRVWRINRFRNSSRLKKRNYDMISNPWTYLKLSTEKENKNKLTLHWIILNYRNE